MAAQFLGLKLRLMLGAFRRSPWQVFGLVIGLLYGAMVTVVVVALLIGARFVDDIGPVRDLVVVGGGVVMLGFLMLPLLFGVDDTLDPRAFSLFGMPTDRLAAGLAIATLIGIPSLVITVCSLATIVTWSRGVLPTLVAVLCAVIAALTCTLGARVTTSIAAFLLATRRAREVGGVVGILLLVIVSPLIVFLVGVDWGRDGMNVLHAIAGVAAWTPLGAVWAAPAAAAMGDGGAALVSLVIALAFLGVIWLTWRALVAKMLVTPARVASAKTYTGLGWFGRVPGIPVGAVAARSITYWARDARYWVSLVMIPLVPLLLVVAFTIVKVPMGASLALLPLPIMCLFLGWSIHNDIAYDGTAIWLHVASGTRGAADRAGRLVPIVLIGIPVIAVGSVLTVFAYGNWNALPAVAGVSTGVLLNGIGLSSLTSALFPYPAPKPGDSTFAQPQHTGATAAFVQSISFVLIVVLSAPSIVLGVMGVLLGAGWFIGALVVGIGVGVVVLTAGIVLGGIVFERRGPEIMAFALQSN
jgi:hypothetical protein